MLVYFILPSMAVTSARLDGHKGAKRSGMVAE